MKKLKTYGWGMAAVLFMVGLLSLGSLTNYPAGISSFGVPVLGSGDIVTTGSVFFVDSTLGSDGNNGQSPTQALKTLEYAIESKVTSAKGDIVVLMPGFSEAVTSAIAWSADSVKVMGVGDNPAQHLLTTATANINLIDVTGDYNTIENIRLTSTATNTSVYEMLDCATTGMMVRGCIFDLAKVNSLSGIDFASGGYSENMVDSCTFIRPAGGVLSQGSGIQHAATRTHITNCDFDLTNGGTNIYPLAIKQTAAGTYGCTITNNVIRLVDDELRAAAISWNASPGDGHAVYRNTVFDASSSTSIFGGDTDLDRLFISNFTGSAAGAETAINPSP